MNKHTPSPGMTPEATGGSPATQINIKSAAGPHSDDCIACNGEGVIRGFATLDPSARRREVDCLRCGGSGREPEPEIEEEE